MITSTSALSIVPPSVTASAAPTINPPSSAPSVRNATSSVPGGSLTLKRNIHSAFNGNFSFNTFIFSISLPNTCQLIPVITEPADPKMSSMGYTSQRRINDNYDVVGFISSGTYGRVYKARNKSGRGAHPVLSRNSGNPIEAFAIKKYAEAHILQAKANL
jgi:hypothetical protein